MAEHKDIANFLRENIPPFSIGSSLYWIDNIGNIKEHPNAVKAIALDKEWRWKYIDENNDMYYIAPGIGSKTGDYLSEENAFEARKSKQVKYAIFVRCESGNICDQDNEDRCFRLLSNGFLYGRDINIIHKNFAEELISRFSLKDSYIALLNVEENYLTYVDVKPDGEYEVGCSLRPLNKYGQRKLEDMFDDCENFVTYSN